MDNVKKYLSNKKELENIDITIEYINIYNQYQNEIAEQFNRIVVIIMKILLIQFQLLLFFWIEIYIYICYLYNKLLFDIKKNKLFDKI